MGNRQSVQQPSSQQNEQSEAAGSSSSSSSNTTNTNATQSESRPFTRSQSAAMRPISRVQAQRTNLRSAVIPVNDNQRRDERRLRRERLRELQQQQEEQQDSEQEGGRSLLSTVSAAMAALGNSESNNTALPPVSPFSRMIATAITEAVMSSFQPNGQLSTATAGTTRTTTEGGGGTAEHRPEFTLHLPPELFQQMEPGSQEDTFMRFMRLPVIISSTPNSHSDTTNASAGTNTIPAEEGDQQPTTSDGPVNANGQAPTLSAANSEITRLLSVPLLLYGQRSDILGPLSSTTPTNTTTESTGTAGTAGTAEGNNTNSQNGAGERQPPTQQPSVTGGQWTLYIISGGSVEGLMSDTNSYEELLELVTLLGPARRPTVSQEAIDNYVPIVKYSEQVKNSILGNAEKCQVCLNDYVLQEDLRILGCHHGFHSSCIDTWLTGGQNKCPLCRDVPVPMSNDEN